MKPANLLILILAAVLTASSCKESITDSRPRIIRPPQDMIWTADTLKPIGIAFQLLPQNLLVFSENDAWLTCWSDIARGLIWHWDGKSWNESDIRKDVGGMRISDIEGYSSSDLWACGYSGEEIFLAHYDGTKWTKYNTNGIKGELLDMCKDADGNIWACGRNGVIMIYDKTKWIKNEIYLNLPLNSFFFLKSITTYNQKVHIIGTVILTNPYQEKYYYLTGNLDNWKFIDSVILHKIEQNLRWGNLKIKTINDNLFSVGLQGCWSLNENNEWQKQIYFNGQLYSISGIERKYLIISGAFSEIKFYNGLNWVDFKLILKVQDRSFVFQDTWTNGYESFVVGYSDGGKVVIWRGK